MAISVMLFTHIAQKYSLFLLQDQDDKDILLSDFEPEDKNISILHLSCRTSDLQFSLILQTHALVL